MKFLNIKSSVFENEALFPKDSVAFDNALLMTNIEHEWKGKIYFISGLGADKRVFRRLVFPADFELIYLDWIAQLKKV